MAHHDHNHRNHRRRPHVTRENTMVHALRSLDTADAANTTPQNLASIGLWTLTMGATGHLMATYAPTGDQVVVAPAPVAPPPTTVRVPYSTGPRGAGQGQGSPALLAQIGGLPTTLPTV